MIALSEVLPLASAHLFAYHPLVSDIAAAAATTSAPGSGDNSGDGEDHKAGPWGLGIVLILCVACYFLFRSMSRHLRTVREEFPDGGGPDGLDGPDGPGGPSSAPATGGSVPAGPAGNVPAAPNVRPVPPGAHKP